MGSGLDNQIASTLDFDGRGHCQTSCSGNLRINGTIRVPGCWRSPPRLHLPVNDQF